jgi:hypothetical protein
MDGSVKGLDFGWVRERRGCRRARWKAEICRRGARRGVGVAL